MRLANPKPLQPSGPPGRLLPAEEGERGVRILAKSLIRSLSDEGYGIRHIIRLSTELLDLAMQQLRDKRSAAMERQEGEMEAVP